MPQTSKKMSPGYSGVFAVRALEGQRPGRSQKTTKSWVVGCDNYQAQEATLHENVEKLASSQF